MIIGVTGTIGSGKNTVANLFVKFYRFKTLNMGDYLRKIEKARKVKPTRNNLRKLQYEIKKKYGPDVMVDMVVSDIVERNWKNVVISGIRDPYEATTLKKKLKMKLIFVDAKPRQRFFRIKGRNRPGDPETFPEFLHFDSLEEATFHLKKTKKLAHYKIDNSKTFKDLEKQVRAVARKLKIKK